MFGRFEGMPAGGVLRLPGASRPISAPHFFKIRTYPKKWRTFGTKEHYFIFKHLGFLGTGKALLYIYINILTTTTTTPLPEKDSAFSTT
jgi:hypothetical protein